MTRNVAAIYFNVNDRTIGLLQSLDAERFRQALVYAHQEMGMATLKVAERRLDRMLEVRYPMRRFARGRPGRGKRGTLGLRAALSDPRMVGPRQGSFVNGFVVGQATVFSEYRAQRYWRVFERGGGPTGDMGRGFLLNDRGELTMGPQLIRQRNLKRIDRGINELVEEDRKRTNYYTRMKEPPRWKRSGGHVRRGRAQGGYIHYRMTPPLGYPGIGRRHQPGALDGDSMAQMYRFVVGRATGMPTRHYQSHILYDDGTGLRMQPTPWKIQQRYRTGIPFPSWRQTPSVSAAASFAKRNRGWTLNIVNQIVPLYYFDYALRELRRMDKKAVYQRAFRRVHMPLTFQQAHVAQYGSRPRRFQGRSSLSSTIRQPASNLDAMRYIQM